MDGALKVVIAFFLVLFGGAFLLTGDGGAVATALWNTVKGFALFVVLPGILLVVGGLVYEKWKRYKFLEAQEKHRRIAEGGK